jgi:hypothetical protein
VVDPHLLGRCENLVPTETQALLRAGRVDKGRDTAESLSLENQDFLLMAHHWWRDAHTAILRKLFAEGSRGSNPLWVISKKFYSV